MKTNRVASANGTEDKTTHLFLTEDQRWEAVMRRDARADGCFYYAVKSTGIYCRPSCGARLAFRANVVFYPSCEEAERAGFRPCKRCRPNLASLRERHTAAVTQACQMIHLAEKPPALAALAAAVGMSPSHFHRVFKSTVGMSAAHYARARRAERVRRALSHRGSVTGAIYEAGFGSSSRFYEKASQWVGMPPKHFQKGGAGVTIRFAVGECSLGVILVAASEKGVCAIMLGDDPAELTRDLQDRFHSANLVGGDRDFEQLVSRVVGFVERPQAGLGLPLDVRGTAFQQRVWQALCEIPLGSTATYAQIANRIGLPKAVRAVGQACGANPIAVAIPCHRVVRTGGDPSGYRWGVDRKRLLLAREAAT